MPITKKNLLLTIGISCFSTSIHAETFNEILACSPNNDNDNDIENVVVYLNGIYNEIDDANASRSILENRLSNVCSDDNCVVEKYYNQTDGYLDDLQELRLVADLEENAKKSGLRSVALKIRTDYIRYKNIFEQNSVTDINQYSEIDSVVWNELRRLLLEAQNEVDAEQTGLELTEWLINNIQTNENIYSIDSSLYLSSMKRNTILYDHIYKRAFETSLAQNYFNNRNFYSSNANARSAITRTVEGLVSYLEVYLLSGKKVVVVAHSQGNHIIELAHSVLVDKWGVEALQAVQVVGVASVASSTPSNTYLTWESDNTVLKGYDFGGGDPLTSNFTARDDLAVENTNGHGFNDVYLNRNFLGRYNPRGQGNISAIQGMLNNTDTEYSVSDWIVGLIEGSMDTAFAYTNEINSTGFLSVSLRWEQYDDMDLWVIENGETTVSYRNFTGIYGQLDRDDRDGDGPEHYTADIDCFSAAGKTWGIGIQQYPSGGSPAIAHLSIKIGNSILKTKSYALSQWPSSIAAVAEINFGEIADFFTLPVEIIISDDI